MGYTSLLNEKAHDEFIEAIEWYELRQKDLVQDLWNALKEDYTKFQSIRNITERKKETTGKQKLKAFHIKLFMNFLKVSN